MTVTTVAVAPPYGAWVASMAHYKRGRSRVQAETRIKSMSSWPRWHDIVYHTRPRRRADKAFAAAVTADRLDAEEAIWAAEKKPHRYYW